MLGDRVFVLIMAIHALEAEASEMGVLFAAPISHSLGHPTYADVDIDGHRYRLTGRGPPWRLTPNTPQVDRHAATTRTGGEGP